jgi:hypothetical protein
VNHPPPAVSCETECALGKTAARGQPAPGYLPRASSGIYAGEFALRAERTARSIQAARAPSGAGAGAEIMTLEGKPLRYLIGGDDRDNEVIELSFDAEAPPKRGIGIKYCNLLDEKYDKKKKTGR